MEKLKKIFSFSTFFFILIIICTIPVSSTNINADFNEIPMSIILSANSKLPIEGTYYMPKVPLKYPERCKIILKNPINENVYMIDSLTDKIVDKDGYYYMTIEEKNLRIPFNPEMGNWKVEITWYQLSDLLNPVAKATFVFPVGESDIMNNLMAPIYIWIDSIPVISNDDLILALPGIFYLSMVIWIPLLIIIVLRYTKTSFQIGKKLLKGERNDKKNN
jgi:hypothetical protein